jgi:hypothetical protein
MRFVLAVLSVVIFGGVALYFKLHGRVGLYWFFLVVAVICPWLFGMQLGRTPANDDDLDAAPPPSASIRSDDTE